MILQEFWREIFPFTIWCKNREKISNQLLSRDLKDTKTHQYHLFPSKEINKMTDIWTSWSTRLNHPNPSRPVKMTIFFAKNYRVSNWTHHLWKKYLKTQWKMTDIYLNISDTQIHFLMNNFPIANLPKEIMNIVRGQSKPNPTRSYTITNLNVVILVNLSIVWNLRVSWLIVPR